MTSDKPGLVIRRQLMDLLTAHGEVEVHRGNVGRPPPSLPRHPPPLT